MMEGYSNNNILTDYGEDHFVDQAEMGCSNETVSDECYFPVHKARGWLRCFVEVSGSIEGGGVDYRFFLEGVTPRFLLSAKQLDMDTFLISTHEDFPKSGLEGYTSRIGYCATACRQADSSFLLAINNCRLCDQALGIFSCGRGDNREIVAKISHATHRHEDSGAEMRLNFVSFPYLNHASPTKLREGRRTWCPRTLLNTGPASMPIDTNFTDRITFHPNNIRCVNKLPVWDSVNETLMLSFLGNRVLSTSVCNFILYEERKLLVKKQGPKGKQQDTPDVPQDPRKATPPCTSGLAFLDQMALPADQSILQFGRAAADKFILDFRYPLSPLQAFGISICTFAFDPGAISSKKIKAKKQLQKAKLQREGVPAAGGPMSLGSPKAAKSKRVSPNERDSDDESTSSQFSCMSHDTLASQRSNTSYLSSATNSSAYSQGSFSGTVYSSGPQGQLHDLPRPASSSSSPRSRSVSEANIFRANIASDVLNKESDDD